jgi:hypothetical protein
MYLASPITITATKPLYQYERQFAICDSCFWCATIFQRLDTSSNNSSDSLEQQQKICTLCKNKSISLVPLAKDEGYTIAIEGKRGLEIEFSKYRR